MNIKEILDLKIGGQWLVSPAANETILCRESFSQEHKDIEKMVLKFASERIFPNVKMNIRMFIWPIYVSETGHTYNFVSF